MPQISFTKLGEQRETGRALRPALIDEDKAATHPGAIHREVIAGMLGHLHRFGGVPVSDEPMPARSAAAAVMNSGAAITCDMSIHPSARRTDLDETAAQPATGVLRNPASHQSTGRSAVVVY
jgi:hypothetical protein